MFKFAAKAFAGHFTFVSRHPSVRPRDSCNGLVTDFSLVNSTLDTLTSFFCCFLLLPSYFVTLTCGIKSVALDLHVTQNIRRWLEATRIIFCFSWIGNVRFLNSLQLQCQVQWNFFSIKISFSYEKKYF